MLEVKVEKHLVDKVTALGGDIRKLKWIGRDSAMDRAVFLFGVHFVELKRPGKNATAKQSREAERLRKHGASVYCLNTIEAVDNFIEEIVRKAGYAV